MIAVGQRSEGADRDIPKVKPNAPAVECPICGQLMKHLANLRLTAAFPASRVYRCYGCDHVLQTEW